MTVNGEPAGARWVGRFAAVWGAQSLAMVGDRLAQFALVWWITSRTGSAAALASAALLVVLPQIVIGPFTGALVDRWNRRRVMIGADAVLAAASAALIYMDLMGATALWLILALMLVRSTAEQFGYNALVASTPLMVPGRHLTRIAGLNRTVEGSVSVVAPALGALLVTVLPLYGVIAVQTCLAVLAIVILTFLRIPQPARTEAPAGAARPTVLADVKEGFRYVWSWKPLFIILSASTLLNMVATPAFSLLPLFVTDVLKGQAIHLGALESAMGAGIIAGGVLLGAWGGFRRKIVTTITGLVIASLGPFLLGVAPVGGIGIATAGIAIMGVMMPMVNGPLTAIVQATVPPGMMGRVGSVMSSMNNAATPIGLAMAAPVAELLGLRPMYLICAAAMFGMGCALPMIRSVMHIEDREPTAANVAAGR